jgi:hypothetical protein
MPRLVAVLIAVLILLLGIATCLLLLGRRPESRGAQLEEDLARRGGPDPRPQFQIARIKRDPAIVEKSPARSSASAGPAK